MNITKKQTMATNLNGKLATDAFIHISLAPPARIRESVLNKTVYIMETEDASWPPVMVKLVDLARFKFGELTTLASWLAWCSHAMDLWQLKQHLIERHPDLSPQSECAIYFFKTIKK